jgi:glycerol-3-phosphate acyltransferase PlsX
MAAQELPLALDAMGGDGAPEIVIQGAERALKKREQLKFVFFGDKERIEPLLAKKPKLAEVSDIVHTTEYVRADDKPSVALRKYKNSSLRLAINAVKAGQASGVVSAGNTGAFMALSKIILKTLPGITRPAIAGRMPNINGDVVMLDLGANVQSDANELFQFAVMGDAYARTMFDKQKPSIGLLNIGSEDMKGHEELQVAHSMLRQAHDVLNYVGFVEGNDTFLGEADVIVTDGFTGNVLLKSSEGLATMIYRILKQNIQAKLSRRLGFLFVKPAFGSIRKVLDPRRLNGAILLGLNGIVVKSHGGADDLAFASAIHVAQNLVEAKVNERIMEELTKTPILEYAEIAQNETLQVSQPPERYAEAT